MKLSNIFKFFVKDKNSSSDVNDLTEEPQPEASITYYIVDGQGPMIDIGLNGYDDKSIDSLCSLLKTLSHDTCFIETVEMVKNGLLKEGQADVAIKILTQMGEIASKKIISSYKESSKDKPCIRPSDMLK